MYFLQFHKQFHTSSVFLYKMTMNMIYCYCFVFLKI